MDSNQPKSALVAPTSSDIGPTDAHWLFEDALYRERYADLTEKSLKATGVGSLYEHYLWIGDLEGRSGSLFFDPAFYQAELSRDDARQSAAEGTCAHFLRHAAVGKRTARTSLYFDPTTYLASYPAAAAAITAGKWVCALHHYLANDTPTEFDPLPYFSERFYLARYPDIAAAIRAGAYRNGYEHFLRHGVSELREANEQIDLAWYVGTHNSIAEDVARGRARDAFAHYLGFSLPARLPVRPPSVPLRAQAMLPVFARRKLDFTCSGPAALSVAMVTRDNFATAMLSLGALRTTYRGAIELLLVDAGSRDETQFIERFVIGAKLLRLASDPGRLQARNAVLTWASAPAILLLDDHVEPAAGAVEAALERLDGDPTVGAVGGRMIDAFEADGGVLHRDPSADAASPLAPEANFVRDVNSCSERFLLLRTTLFNDLNGFDETAAEGSDTIDLCRRIAEAGYRIMYDPTIVAFGYDYNSPSPCGRGQEEGAAGRTHHPTSPTDLPEGRRGEGVLPTYPHRTLPKRNTRGSCSSTTPCRCG